MQRHGDDRGRRGTKTHLAQKKGLSKLKAMRTPGREADEVKLPGLLLLLSPVCTGPERVEVAASFCFYWMPLNPCKIFNSSRNSRI